MAIDDGVLTQLHEHVDENLYNILFEDSKAVTPLFAFCEAQSPRDGFGKQLRVRITTSEGSAISADPEVSDTQATDGDPGARPTRNEWILQAVTKDASFTFTRDELLAIEGMKPAEQFDVMADELEKAIIRVRNKMSEEVGNTGWGKVAQSESQDATSFTVDPALCNRFKVGDRLVASITEDTDVLLGTPAGAVLRVTGVNTRTGAITLSGNPQTTWANDQDLFMFREGDRIATDPGALTANKVCITGLTGVINPDNDELWGVTTTDDPTLTGYGIQASGDTESTLIDLVDILWKNGKAGGIVLVNSVTWKILQKTKQANQLVRVDTEKFSIGFKAIEIPVMNGTAMVLPDAHLPPGTAVAGPFDSKKEGPKLYHSGKNLINIDDLGDGLRVRRTSGVGSRSFLGNVFFRGQFVIPGPGNYSIVTDLPTE